MAIPAFTGLETALRGLEANQAAIDTTGHNIANVNTPGYSRESVILAESPSLTLPVSSNVTGAGVQLGTGVEVSTISLIRDQFLDVQYRAQSTAAGAASEQSSELAQVQTAVNEPSSDGIGASMSAFWNAWNDLGNNPTSAAAQEAVVQAGQTLAQTFNTVDGQMAAVQNQTAAKYASLTGAGGQVAQYAGQIATLNQQISQATTNGLSTNDLLDQRDAVIDKLSALARVSVSTASNGVDTVSFGDGAAPLVSGATVNWPQTLTSAAGGQLGTLLSLSSASGPIGQLRSQLDGVASQVANAVNALQPSSPFFTGNTAGTIAVVATASSVQASSSATSGPDLAQQIAALSGGPADQSYAAFVAGTGNAVQSAQSASNTATSLLTAIDNQRQSVGGVSLDEEMSNLITFQRGYEASARMMDTINSVLGTLISSVGGAGL